MTLGNSGVGAELVFGEALWAHTSQAAARHDREWFDVVIARIAGARIDAAQGQSARRCPWSPASQLTSVMRG